jgi:hypothetical protein
MLDIYHTRLLLLLLLLHAATGKERTKVGKEDHY